MQYSDADPVDDFLAAFRSAQPHVLDDLYQAATGHRTWSQALGTLAQAAAAHSVGLALMDEDRIVARVGGGAPHAAGADGYACGLDGGRFHAKADLQYGRQFELYLQRSHQQGPFTAPESAALESLLPHLQRAVLIHDVRRRQHSEVAAVNHAAERGALPFLVVDDQGRLRYVSREAGQIIETTAALSVQQERLQLRNTGAAQGLPATLPAISTGNGPAGVIRIPRQDRTDLHLVHIALPLDDEAVELTQPMHHTAVYLHDPERCRAPDPALLIAMYDLTPSEARVASLMAEGLIVPEITRHSGTTRNTVRTQIKSIFRKTGTRRQTELVRLLSSGLVHLD